MSVCRSCNAEILWAVTAKRKRIPLDREPSPEGTLIWRATYVEMAVGADPDEPRYISHFATCPNAAQHRRRP